MLLIYSMYDRPILVYQPFLWNIKASPGYRDYRDKHTGFVTESVVTSHLLTRFSISRTGLFRSKGHSLRPVSHFMLCVRKFFNVGDFISNRRNTFRTAYRPCRNRLITPLPINQKASYENSIYYNFCGSFIVFYQAIVKVLNFFLTFLLHSKNIQLFSNHLIILDHENQHLSQIEIADDRS